MRRARVDANQTEIVAAFRQLGYSVLHLHQVGHGCPDLAIGKRGNTWLVEIKDGKKSPSRQKLTSDEEIFFSEWKGNLLLITSTEDAIAFDRKHYKKSIGGI